MHVFFGVVKLGFFLLLRIPSLPLFSTYTKNRCWLRSKKMGPRRIIFRKYQEKQRQLYSKREKLKPPSMPNWLGPGAFLFSPGGLSVRIAVCYVYPGLGFVYVVLTCNFFFSSRLMRYFSARSIIRMICSFLRSSLVRACPFCSDCYTNFLPISALFSQLTDSRFALSLCYVVGACARVLLAYLIIVNNLEVA